MQPPSARLPIRHDLSLAYASSVAVALLMAVVSVVGIASSRLYDGGLQPGHPMVSRGGDGANLLVGLPILLGALWLMRRGSIVGLLLWPGALFYVSYTYGLYVVAAPLNALFLPYVLLVTLSVYTLIAILAAINGDSVRKRLASLPARLLGGVLVVVGALAIAGLTWQVIGGLVGTTPTEPAIGTPAIAVDFIVGSAPLVIGGVLLWRRQSLGYVTAAGLLLVSAAGGVAFALGGVFEGLLTGAVIDAWAITIHLVIAAVACAFLAVYVRGAARAAVDIGRTRSLSGARAGRRASKEAG